MKRKDYELVSKVISKLKGEVKVTDCPVKVLVWDKFADAFQKGNGNFNEQAFRKDCEVDK